MGSVIEHQKVARRRRRPDGNRMASPGEREALVSRHHRRRRGIAVYALSLRRRLRSGRPRLATMSVQGSSATAVSTALTAFPLHTVRRRTYRLPLRRIGRAIGSNLFELDARDLPLYTAVLLFSVLVNLALLSVGVDRIVLSGAIRGIALPPQEQLVARSSFSREQSDFAVIGETTGVDTERFSRLQVTSYTVRPGDTLGAIAIRNGLEMDTLISFNRIEDVRRIQAGSTFQIPDRDGLLYTVRRGDTLSGIAADHNTSVNAILDSNDLRSGTVQEGDVLFVPGARMNNTELRIILGELFAWPMRGAFTSGFGMRPDPFTGQTRFHNGIDISNAMGTPVRAAASGRVVHVENQIGNYGRFVILRHADGFQTLYAHLDSFSVRTGQTVSRGQQIGRMGNSGRSTGPHLHFSVVHNGRFVNPMRYLH